jgi:threonine/homoserine/homoserine lactone efflux protein
VTNAWLVFAAVLTVLATPGPTNTLLATGAAAKGFRRALPLVTAELLGYLVTVDVVGFLLRPILATQPMVAIGLKLLIGLYLAYMAVRLWLSARRAALAEASPVTWGRVFVATLLNPKGLIFAGAILPFASPEIGLYLLGFAVSILAMGMAWLAAGHFIGRLAGERRGIVPRIASVALVGFAGLITASIFT